MRIAGLVSIACVALLIVSSCAVQDVPSSSRADAPKVIKGPSCRADSDCVASDCCHPSSCVMKSEKPYCAGIMCTTDCRPGTMDCGQGSCACKEGSCVAVIEGNTARLS